MHSQPAPAAIAEQGSAVEEIKNPQEKTTAEELTIEGSVQGLNASSSEFQKIKRQCEDKRP